MASADHSEQPGPTVLLTVRVTVPVMEPVTGLVTVLVVPRMVVPATAVTDTMAPQRVAVAVPWTAIQ